MGGKHEVKEVKHIDSRGLLPEVASEPGIGEKVQWKMENLCRLHRSKQSVPKGLLPTAEN